MTSLHIALRTRRQAIGMSEARLARILGVSHMSLYDLETHTDEWRTVTPFATLMTACRLVGMERAGAIAIEIGDCLTLWPFDVIAFVADALEIDCCSFVENTMWRRD